MLFQDFLSLEEIPFKSNTVDVAGDTPENDVVKEGRLLFDFGQEVVAESPFLEIFAVVVAEVAQEQAVDVLHDFFNLVSAVDEAEAVGNGAFETAVSVAERAIYHAVNLVARGCQEWCTLRGAAA